MQTRLFGFSRASSGVCLCSFTTVIGTSVRIASVSISLVLLIRNEIVKLFLKIMRKKKTNMKIKWIKFKVPISSNISHEEFTLVINEQLIGNQLNDIERDGLTEHGKRIRQNERLKLKLKTVV